MAAPRRVSITSLPDSAALAEADLLPVYQGGGDTASKLTVAQLGDYFATRTTGAATVALLHATGNSALDGPALQLLLTIGGPAYLSGEFVIDTALAGTRAVQWSALGVNTSIDQTALASGVPAITVAGSQGGSVSVSTDAGIDDLQIEVADASQIEAGQQIRIASSAVWDPARTDSTIGMLNYCVGKTGSVLDLLLPLEFDFLVSDAAYVRPITALDGVAFDGLVLVGEEGGKYQSGLDLKYCRKPRISGGAQHFISGTQYRLFDCFGGLIEEHASDVREPTNTGYANSVVGPSRDIVIRGHVSRGARHAMTTNNSASSPGITKNVTYEDFAVYGTVTSLLGAGGDAVDRHAGSDGWTVRRGVIHKPSGQGINDEGVNSTVEDVKIFGAGGNGIGLYNLTERDSRYRVARCEVDGAVTALRVLEAPTVTGGTPGGKLRRLEIDGFGARNYTQTGLYVVSEHATKSAVVSYRGLDLDHGASSNTNGAILLQSVKTVVHAPSVVRDMVSSGAGHKFTDCDNFQGFDLGLVAYEAGVASTGTGAYFDTLSASEPQGSFKITVEADDTGGGNTSKGFNNDPAVSPPVFREVYGNPASSGVNYSGGAPVVESQTIASGVITLESKAAIVYVRVATEGAASTDDLVTITPASGAPIWQTIIVQASSSSADVVLKHATGNLRLNGAADFTLDTSLDGAMFKWNGTQWCSVAPPANNG